MHGQAEGAPMHRQKRAAAEQRQRFERVLRSKMNIAPSRMIGADFQHHQVKWPEPVANQLVLARESGITAEEHGVPFRANDKGGPQSGVAVFERPTGEMLRWRRTDG